MGIEDVQMTQQSIYKTIQKTISGIATSDGAGVSLTRIIGQPALPRLDPFLMLDFFGSDNPGEYIAGFPPHPHRGFQTVTYMLAGQMRHKDSVGNEGLIKSGGIQWMNAGKGIIHEEMPEQKYGLLKGFQLWVNLPAKDKLSKPNYQDIPPEQVPEVKVDDAEIKILAGNIDDVEGPVKTTAIAPTFLDVYLAQGNTTVPLKAGDTSFFYVYEGSLEVQAGHPSSGQTLNSGQLAVLSTQGEKLYVSSTKGTKFILVSGKPINEPVVQYGPFVMNTQKEIVDAFNDYQNGTLTD